MQTLSQTTPDGGIGRVARRPVGDSMARRWAATWRRSVGAAVCALATGGSILLTAPSLAHAAAITVTTADDVAADDGACSLREAMIAANSDTSSGASAGECVAGSGADTIVLPAATTFLLTSTLPQVITAVAIDGNDSTIDADRTGRVLDVASTGSLTIDATTITGGETTGHGGGILNAGVVTLTGSTVIDNIAGADSGRGGGIRNSDGGSLSLADSVVADNTAWAGGGISTQALAGPATIERSTISGNSATIGGGGLLNEGTAALVNSTVSGNSVAGFGWGGGVFNSGDLTVSFSTISHNTGENGGGLMVNTGPIAGATTRLESSIVTDNVVITSEISAYNDTGMPPVFDGIETGGFNVLGSIEDTITVYDDDPTSLVDQSDVVEPLADNGGATETHAITTASPACSTSEWRRK